MADYDPGGYLVRGGLTFVEAMTTDEQGSVYLSGWVYGYLKKGLNRYNVHEDIFLVKYNTDGEMEWLEQFAANGKGMGLSTDRAGNVYMTGIAYDYLWGDYQNGESVFLVKYRSDGRRKWLRQFEASTSDKGKALAVDASGDIYLLGETGGNFEGGENRSVDVFLAKYDPDGERKWIRQFNSPEYDQAEGLAIAPSGVYVNLDEYYSEKLLLLKYGADGRFLRRIEIKTDAGWISGRGMAISGQGELHLSGFVFEAFPGFKHRGHVDAFLQEIGTERRRPSKWPITPSGRRRQANANGAKNKAFPGRHCNIG